MKQHRESTRAGVVSWEESQRGRVAWPDSPDHRRWEDPTGGLSEGENEDGDGQAEKRRPEKAGW